MPVSYCKRSRPVSDWFGCSSCYSWRSTSFIYILLALISRVFQPLAFRNACLGGDTCFSCHSCSAFKSNVVKAPNCFGCLFINLLLSRAAACSKSGMKERKTLHSLMNKRNLVVFVSYCSPLMASVVCVAYSKPLKHKTWAW